MITIEELIKAGVQVKQCTTCEEFKPTTEFQSQPAGKCGVGSTCRLCVSKHDSLPHNMERRKLHNRRLVKENKELVSVKGTEYYQKDKEKNPAKYLYKGAKKRAKETGVGFDIEVSDINIPEICPVLGIPLNKLRYDGMKRYSHSDDSPSLDRVDSSKGYIKGNICVMSTKANIIKNSGTAEEHRKIAEFMDKWEGK